MKIPALIVSALAAAAIYAAIRLMMATHEFASSDHYASGRFSSFTYSAWPVEADGSAVYGPALLVLALGLFLARFAYNLWKPDQQRHAARHRQRPSSKQ